MSHFWGSCPQMKLSIIIVSYNHKDFLIECLKNIKNSQMFFDYEVFVVDNNSTDGSIELLSKLNPDLVEDPRRQSHREIQNSPKSRFTPIGQAPDNNKSSRRQAKLKTIFNRQNLGFARANNQAIKLAQGEYILILNPDVFVKKDSIVKLINFMENHPAIALSGPKLISPDGQLQYSCLRFPKWYIPILRRTFLGNLKMFEKELYSYLMIDFDHKEPREVDWLMGAALMVRKKAIEKIGLMDERFFAYFEDIDWSRRFKEKGLKVYYYPDSEMVHSHQRLSFVRGPMAIFNRITWIHIFSWLKYLIKYL